MALGIPDRYRENGAAAALSMITDKAGSDVPAIGYSVAYATSSITLTLFGIVIVLLS